MGDAAGVRRVRLPHGSVEEGRGERFVALCCMIVRKREAGCGMSGKGTVCVVVKRGGDRKRQ